MHHAVRANSAHHSELPHKGPRGACYDPPLAKPLFRWNIYLVQSKGRWLGEIEAGTVEEAIALATKRFGQEAGPLAARERGIAIIGLAGVFCGFG
jgi:hypothetical protein